MIERIIPELEKHSLPNGIERNDIYRISDSKEPPWERNAIADLKNNHDEIEINYGQGLESVDITELQKAIKIVKESIEYIIKRAYTEKELITAEVLKEYMKEGKIVICDTGGSYGGFGSGYDTDTRKIDTYIFIDFESLAYGKDVAIDTIMHEAYHAAQYKAGNKNDCIEEELRAWNLGLDMSNRYREDLGETITQEKPYTTEDIESFGYVRDLGENVFAEITENRSEVLA